MFARLFLALGAVGLSFAACKPVDFNRDVRPKYNVYMRFDWDANNREKIAAHGVTTREFEQAFLVRRVQEHNLVGRERRKYAFGQTEAGRVLAMIYTMRGGKVRAITAYESRKARILWQEK